MNRTFWMCGVVLTSAWAGVSPAEAGDYWIARPASATVEVSDGFLLHFDVPAWASPGPAVLYLHVQPLASPLQLVFQDAMSGRQLGRAQLRREQTVARIALSVGAPPGTPFVLYARTRQWSSSALRVRRSGLRRPLLLIHQPVASVSLAPTREQSVRRDVPDTVLDASDLLLLRGPDKAWDAQYAYLSFTIPSLCRPSRARLRFHYANLSGPNLLAIAPTTSSWSPATLSWSKRPTRGAVTAMTRLAGGAASLCWGSTSLSCTSGTGQIEATGLLAAGSPVHFQLWLRDEGWAAIPSSGQAEPRNQPRLVVEHDPLQCLDGVDKIRDLVTEVRSKRGSRWVGIDRRRARWFFVDAGEVAWSARSATQVTDLAAVDLDADGADELVALDVRDRVLSIYRLAGASANRRLVVAAKSALCRRCMYAPSPRRPLSVHAPGPKDVIAGLGAFE